MFVYQVNNIVMDKKELPSLSGYRLYMRKYIDEVSPHSASILPAGNYIVFELIKVSLITIVYNGESTLRRTMNSVFSQSYSNIEYIVIDGGSTDGTLDIINEFSEKITSWISEPDLGISDAFNKGLVMATGDIVGFINADDWLESGAIQTVVSKMSVMKKPAIVHGMIRCYSARNENYLVAGDHDLLDKDMTVNHPSVFVTSDCYQFYGVFRLDFRCAMDYEWLLRARSGGANFAYIPEVLANMQTGGVSDKKWIMAIREVARAKTMHFGNGCSNYCIFISQVIKGAVRRMLDCIGLSFIGHYYHNHFSRVKKSRSFDGRV